MPTGIRSKIFRVSLQPFAWLLKTGDEHATIDRLFESKHVGDLQFIFAVSCIAVSFVSCVGAGIAVHNMMQKTWHWDDAVVKCLKYGGPMLVVFGGVVSWAYKTGSLRLGVVDLFGCEIRTLCRVTKVIETVRQCVYRVDHPPAEHANAGRIHLHEVPQFTSQENYFPVFESNNQALQALEALVVVNITAFYTNMKAFRDSLRALAQISSATAEANDPRALGAWQTAAGNSVYMLFLALESGRRAIVDLIEYEPDQAENTIVVLLSELEASRFLRLKFSKEDDIYGRRIELRVPEYEKKVPDLIELVTCMHGSKEADKWEPAYLLLDELQRRYEEAISKFPEGGPPVRSLTALA
jgi:hypothetical protein